MKKNKINVGNIIQSIFLIFLLLYGQFSYAQTTQGSLIPNGKTVFLDNNGNPLSSGKVFFYSQGTTTPKTTYQDINQTIPNANPVILDAAGRPSGSSGLWGIGVYRQIVQDKNSNTIWDVTTSTSGTGGTGPTATGDGDAVGTLKQWSGITAPNQYMFTYGQALNRTTYAALFQAITSTQAVFCTSGSPAITGLSNTDSFWIGMSVELSCVPAGFTTIIAKTSSSVTLAVNANASVNTNATFFMWGNGNHSTTFNLPDYRGLIPMGNNIMGGVASTNISDTYFGATSAKSAGALGGVTGGGQTLSLAQLPTGITSAGSNTITVFPNNNSLLFAPISSGSTTEVLGGGGPGTSPIPAHNPGSTWVGTSNFSGGNIVSVTSNNTNGNAFSIIPPTKTVNFIIKVTPDTAFSGTGVTSLGGMTGDIACGAGLTCAGGTISAISVNSITGPGTSTDRAISTWNGTSGAALRDNPVLSISSAGALQANAGFGATSIAYLPNNFANSSICYGNGCTNLVHNAGTFTATITGTDMNVTAITTGTVPWERLGTATLSGSGVTVGTQIRAQVSGTPNGIGHYTITPSQTVSSPTAMTAISLEGYYNTSTGLTSFLNATTASYNTFVGFETGEFCTTCFANTGFGEATLIYNIDGGGNTAVGWKALLGTPTFGFGDYNTAVGYSSGWANGNTGGTMQNTSLGAFSLSAATLSGNTNVALGYNAGSGITSGSNNTVIGPNVVTALATGSNNTAIGACNSGYVGATANLVQLCDGAGNVVLSGAGTGGGISFGSPVNLASGGTAANLSATGGTSQVLKQVSTGAPITVGQLTGNDLTKGVYIIAMSAATGMTVTGTVAETTLATVAIPGNTLGANGALRITAQLSKTGTAGTTEMRIKFGGTTYFDSTAAGATVLSGRFQTEIHNRNATNSQIGTSTGQLNWALQPTTASVTTALDTTASQNVTFTCQLGNTGDTCELSSYTVEVLKP